VGTTFVWDEDAKDGDTEGGCTWYFGTPFTSRELIVLPTSPLKWNVPVEGSGKNAFGPNSSFSHTVDASSYKNIGRW